MVSEPHSSTPTAPAHASLGKSIAIAEGASSAAALGTVWLVGHNPHLIKPATDFVSKHIIYPLFEQCSGTCTPEEKDNLLQKAQKQASLLLKGVVMVGAGFVTHIPTQMLMEGRWDVKEFKKVVAGKSAGLAVSLGGLAAINYLKPGSIEAVENKVADKLFDCEKSPSKEYCESDRELCKLMVIDLPSSVISGLMNYQLAKRF